MTRAKEKVEATPRPWRWYKPSGNESEPNCFNALESEGVNGKTVLTYSALTKDPNPQVYIEVSDADAELIVRAVNNHDALVEACELSLDALGDFPGQHNGTKAVLRQVLGNVKGSE